MFGLRIYGTNDGSGRDGEQGISGYGQTKMQLSNSDIEAIAGEHASEERIYEVDPVHYVNKNVPPVFLWHTAADDIVYVGNSLTFALKLEEHKSRLRYTSLKPAIMV